eukprot:1138816-Pelagomonas_calceolata.AAC.1
MQTISNLACTSQGHIFFYKVKSHAGITGNECTDKIAKYQASLKCNNLIDVGRVSSAYVGASGEGGHWARGVGYQEKESPG